MTLSNRSNRWTKFNSLNMHAAGLILIFRKLMYIYYHRRDPTFTLFTNIFLFVYIFDFNVFIFSKKVVQCRESVLSRGRDADTTHIFVFIGRPDSRRLACRRPAHDPTRKREKQAATQNFPPRLESCRDNVATRPESRQRCLSVRHSRSWSHRAFPGLSCPSSLFFARRRISPA